MSIGLTDFQSSKCDVHKCSLHRCNSQWYYGRYYSFVTDIPFTLDLFLESNIFVTLSFCISTHRSVTAVSPKMEKTIRHIANVSYWWRIYDNTGHDYPDSKVHGANIGPMWGRQDPGGPHVGPVNFALWVQLGELYVWSYEIFETSVTSQLI